MLSTERIIEHIEKTLVFTALGPMGVVQQLLDDIHGELGSDKLAEAMENIHIARVVIHHYRLAEKLVRMEAIGDVLTAVGPEVSRVEAQAYLNVIVALAGKKQ